jgi:hypothetical protein
MNSSEKPEEHQLVYCSRFFPGATGNIVGLLK